MPDPHSPQQAGLFDPQADSSPTPPTTEAGSADGVPATLPLPEFLAETHKAEAIPPPAGPDANAGPPGAEPGDSSPPAPPPKTRVPLWSRLLGALLDPWLKLDIGNGQPPKDDLARPVCYVLEDYGLSNALILQRACRESGLPEPLLPIAGDPLGRKRAYVALSRRHANALGLLPGAEHKTHSGSLARLLQAHRDNPELDVQLVPVSIFVGQAPKRSSGWFSVLFSCWRCCSTAATPSCSLLRRSHCTGSWPKASTPSAPCANSRACCAPISGACAKW